MTDFWDTKEGKETQKEILRDLKEDWYRGVQERIEFEMSGRDDELTD